MPPAGPKREAAPLAAPAAFLAAIEHLLEAASGILVAISLVAVVVQVVMRYGFNHATTWSDTLATVALAWIAFISATAAVRSERNLAVRFLVLRLPWPARRVMMTLTHLAILYFGITLARSGIELMSLTRTSMVVGMPFAVTWAHMYSISVGCGVLMAIFSIERIALLWLRGEP